MESRQIEAHLLGRCVAVALSTDEVAVDQREANFFMVAAVVILSKFPTQSKALALASQRYFAKHPTEALPPAEVLHKGWVTSLPRLRDSLCHAFQNANANPD